MHVLLLARELSKVGLVSVDGTRIEASANKHRSVRYDRAGELVEQLELEIGELMARADAADGSGEDDRQALPREIARREALRDQLDAARDRLETQARARAAAERARTTRPGSRRVTSARGGARRGARANIPSRGPRRRARRNRATPVQAGGRF